MSEFLEQIKHLIEEEKGLGSVTDLSDLQARIGRRLSITRLMSRVVTEVRQIQQQVKQLSSLPSLESVQRAQAILAMPNLIYLEIDTVGVHEGAEITHVLLLDPHGDSVLDLYINPQVPIPPDIYRRTGISEEDVVQAPTLPAVWSALTQALSGHYIVSYGLDFDTGKLKEQAEKHILPAIPIIGECLRQLGMQFFVMTSYPSLADLCQRIGHPLPSPPYQTAFDRALGQKHLLSAISTAFRGEEPPF